MAAGFGCDGFEGCAELVDPDLQPGECERFAMVLAVFFDDGAELGAVVEGSAPDAGVGGDHVEGDGVADGEQGP